MKILIVGGVAGGASAAAKLRRFSEEDEIIMFERGPHVSFSNCALPYHLSGMIEPASRLVLMNPEKFKKQYNIEARVNEEVVAIDRARKVIKIKKVLTGEVYEESYDKLILSPGAKPNKPEIQGSENMPIFTVRNVEDIAKIKSYMVENKLTQIAIVGGGYIGIEVAENIREAGYEVSLIEGAPQILRTFDEEMVQVFHKVLDDHGVKLLLNHQIKALEKDYVILSDDTKVPAQMVIMAIGVHAENELAKMAGLEVTQMGSIAVDNSFRTNDPDIYAIGDAIEVNSLLTDEKMRLTLAGPAQKAARAVAGHINGEEVKKQAYIGSSAIKVFDYNGASTGLTEAQIKMKNLSIKYDKVHFMLGDKVGLMPDSSPMHFKLIYEVPSGRVLGAQAIGKGSVDKRIDVIATAMKFNATVYDLRELELCYAPPFGTAKDIVNYAGFIACNVLEGRFKQITVDKVRDLVAQGAYIVDVREKGEYERGHIKGAHLVPLSKLRESLSEIPKDQPVYIHCRTGQRSYNAVLALQNLGYDQVINITGGFLGLSFYEYFKDKTEDRESILTNYNFN
nr:FAD-dependent oxidoreductase [uncultured Cellulosilyticum sp.]